MTMGERITALRKGRGMTQEQLAERLSVTRQSISKWELDQAIPEVGCAVALCNLFEVSLDYLVRGIEPQPPAGEAEPEAASERDRPQPEPARPKPLTAKGYASLSGLLLLLAVELCLHLLLALHAVGAEAGMTVISLLFGVIVPLPAVYLATQRWYYTDCGHALRHLWGVTAIAVMAGNIGLIGGLMLYLRRFADAYVFWSVGWEEVWCKFLTAELFALAVLLPFLLRFHEKKWLCWVGYALSWGVYVLGLLLDFELTDLIPASGQYGALWDAAVRLAAILLLAVSQVILYARLRRSTEPCEGEAGSLSPWMLWGIPALCALGLSAVLGGLYYALAFAGCSAAYLPLATVPLPLLLTVLLRGRRSLSYRRALAEAGGITGIGIPLTLAAHFAMAWLAAYLLTFGGPMPDLNWAGYALLSLASAIVGGAVTIPSLKALRKRPLICCLLCVLLLVGAVTASLLLPDPLYRL